VYNSRRGRDAKLEIPVDTGLVTGVGWLPEETISSASGPRCFQGRPVLPQVNPSILATSLM
jgi:hypothetical protein